MNILNGLRNFIMFINNNWTSIIIIIGLVIALYQKIKSLVNKSKYDKINAAMSQIKEIVLKIVSEAESEYKEQGSGKIKRSQVINQIFEKYPVLLKATDQEKLIEWIDTAINESLETLYEISSANKTK